MKNGLENEFNDYGQCFRLILIRKVGGQVLARSILITFS